MWQKFEAIGRVSNDPKFYQPKKRSGSSCCIFTLGVQRGYQDQKGEDMDWVPVVVWRELAEHAATYLYKGRLILVVGRVKWDDMKAEVVADFIKYLDSPDGREFEDPDEDAPMDFPRHRSHAAFSAGSRQEYDDSTDWPEMRQRRNKVKRSADYR